MPCEIYVISGFLGAGKTTLIQQLIKNSFADKKTAIIENDFGEISVDASLFREGNVEVREINSGCICCSLFGNFVTALKGILTEYKPEAVIIEPSGVGKLSDILKACMDKEILSLASVKAKITVVDVKKFKLYLNNFGEFFEDQIKHAGAVVLSRTEDFPDKIPQAIEMIKPLNKNCIIVSKSINQISLEDFLILEDLEKEKGKNLDIKNQKHIHGRKQKGSHSHFAENTFETVTIKPNRTFSKEELEKLISEMELNTNGNIIRAKGIFASENGYLNLQYTPNELKITESTVSSNVLSIIGQNLNKENLLKIFGGE